MISVKGIGDDYLGENRCVIEAGEASIEAGRALSTRENSRSQLAKCLRVNAVKNLIVSRFIRGFASSIVFAEEIACITSCGMRG